MTQDEVRAYIVALLPPGSDKLYDLASGGDFYQLFDAAAAIFKSRGFDLLDLLRREINPGTCSQKLPDWEHFLGISNTYPALFGTDTQRQNNVKGKLREYGPFDDTVVASVLSPLLGYFAATTVQIIKTLRTDLQNQNQYAVVAVNTAIADGVTQDFFVRTLDGGKVSKGAPRFVLQFASAFTGTATLYAPDGTSQAFSLTATTLYNGTARDLIGASMNDHMGGVFKFRILNSSGGSRTLNNNSTLFVEGIGPGQSTGGAIFEWGVYADPTHVAESGTPADYASARQAINRIEHSHTLGNLIQSLSAYPDTDSGAHAAIPDEFLPE